VNGVALRPEAVNPDAGQARPAPRASPACDHCGLPVPAGLVDESAREQFCCAGCRTVYEVIHGCQLERFYRIRDEASWDAEPARVSGRRYDECDDAAFQRTYGRLDAACPSIELLLEGVHCGACVWLIEKLPRIVPGVLEARLNLQRARVHVTWDPQRVRLSQICRALDSLGYAPHPARGAAVEDQRRREERRFLIRIAIAGAAAGNAMLLAFALYAGAYSGMEPAYTALLRGASAFVGLVSVAWPGSVFFRGAWAALRTRTAHIDIPIALALSVGAVSGLINIVTRSGEIYFDSLTMLVFLLLAARWVQRRQQRQAMQAVELLFALTPTSARRVRGDACEDVSIESLQVGDVVEVRAQESVPVDGRVVQGESHVDQSLLTGEAQPILVAAGDAVHAGTLSLSGQLRVQVSAAGEQTRVGQLMRLVEESLRRKAPIVQLADRISAAFIAALLVLAALTLGLWLWLDPSRAADHTVALLIVACPCALGLATPLAIAVAIGRAARRGILIKGGAALEQLARPGTILLDKTGTVTTGRMRLVRWQGPDEVRPLVAALESRASHPIARALTDALRAAELPPVDAAEQLAAGGIIGRVADRAVVVGSRRFVRARIADEPRWVAAFASASAADALTPVFVAVDGRLVAAAALGDALRPDAAASIAQLRREGWRVELLSGDAPAVVARVAGQLEIAPAAAQGAATPEQKLARVKHLAASEAVVMIGDGVNDAAALAAAQVGIAVHGGAQASFAAADVYLSREGLAPIVDLVDAARRTLRAIRRCLVASLLYNAAGVALAMAGLLSPLLAALLMPASSLTVVSLALGARTFGDERCR